MNRSIIIGACILITPLLSGCLASAGQTIGMSAAQGAASNAIQAPIIRNAASNMTCEQMQDDIASRKMAMINPLAIPDVRRQIAIVEEVAREKGCPGYVDTSDNNTETVEPLKNTNY